MVNYLSVAAIPLLITAIVGYGLLQGLPVFDHFLQGAKSGLQSAVGILPALVGLMTAIAMLRASGALDGISHLLTPVLSLLRIPPQLVPLALMRPVSGSGALAIVKDLLTQYGADSMVGRMASVMMGSSETTFYTLAIYLGSVAIKNSRYTVKAALLGDLTGILASVYMVRLFLSGS